MQTKLFKSLCLGALLTAPLFLTACNKYVDETNETIETVLERTEDYMQQAAVPDLPIATDTVRVKNDIWLGSSSVKITEGEPLPAHLEEKDAITLSIGKEESLAYLTQEIKDITGISARLDNLKAENAVPEDKIALNFEGSLSSLLDYLADRYGVWWRYKNNVITFYTRETRVFNIYALPTETSVSMSLNGASMGTDGGSSSSSLSSSANLALWDNIEEGLRQIVGEHGDLSFSRVAGTVTITGSPFIISEAGDWINIFNEKLSRQVAISVKVLQVSIENTDDYGFDLNAVFNSTDIAGSFISPTATTASATAGLLSMTLLKPDSKWSSSKAIIQALSTQGKTSLVTSASATTLNNKVAPIQVTTQENYVKETTVTTTGSGDDATTDTDMETDTLNYGFMLDVMPRILDHGRLILMFSLSITDLVSLDTFSSTGETIDNENSSDEDTDDDDDSSSDDESEYTVVQLPKIQSRGFIQEIAMRSGSTLVLSGFERVSDTVATSGIGKAKLNILGGRNSNENTRQVIVVLLTPEVLESPLSAESRMKD